MMNFIEYFWTNIGNTIGYTIEAFIIAIIFVIFIEKYFNVTLKNPGTFRFCNKNPVGRIPKIRNPMRK